MNKRTSQWLMLLLTVVAGIGSGCQQPRASLTPREQAIAAAARPILTLDPDTVWVTSYNRLLEFGPDSIRFLIEQPAMARPAAPDSLDTLLHASLIRLLATPGTCPKLTTSAFDTTLGVLHFEIKVAGQALGPIVMPRPTPPPAWHDLYPAAFDHRLAAHVDIEGDRQALRAWWRLRGEQATTRRPLKPITRHLWPLLSRQYADRWQYQPTPRALRCAWRPRPPTLFDMATHDYNLVRAACLWLGTRDDRDTQRRLIDLVGSPAPVVAHNARFALRHSPDPRIRDVIKQYDEPRAERDATDSGPTNR